MNATGRLLMIKRAGSIADGDEDPPPPHVMVVLNWFEQLKERVPTGR